MLWEPLRSNCGGALGHSSSVMAPQPPPAAAQQPARSSASGRRLFHRELQLGSSSALHLQSLQPVVIPPSSGVSLDTDTAAAVQWLQAAASAEHAGARCARTHVSMSIWVCCWSFVSF